MPRNGSGTYTLAKPAFVPGTTISSADVNSDFSDIAVALTASIAADGQTPITAPIKFSSGTASLPSITFTADQSTGIYYPGVNKIGMSAGGLSAIVLDTSRQGTGQDGNVLQYAGGAVILCTGTVVPFAGSTVPLGWQLCYGQAISRANYAELFDVVGTTYGSGDGVTTFNLPDMRGRTVYGKDNMGGTPANRITVFAGTTLGAVGGSQVSSLSTSNLPTFTPSGTVTASDSGHFHTVGNVGNTFVTFVNSGGNLTGLAGGPTFSNLTSAVNIGTAIITAGFTGASIGSNTSFSTISPGLIFNYIIFAGRA